MVKHEILLRLEIKRLIGSGILDKTNYVPIIEQIEALWSEQLAGFGALPDNHQWSERRVRAWALLERRASCPIGLPPWRDMKANRAAPQSSLDWEQGLARPRHEEELSLQAPTLTSTANLATADIPHQLSQPEPIAIQTPSVPAVATKPSTSIRASSSQIASVQPPLAVRPAENYAWLPAKTSLLERALETMTGWHKLATPFLVQNIGWFIGGFCFIAGSIFLVSYTTGYVKALTIFGTLLLYTLLLLWGGYQLRLRKPDLQTASGVLLTLGVLLVPLTITAATRLLVTAQGSPWLLLSALLAIAIGLGVFYLAVALVSALMDRSLERRHPRLFLALTVTQLMAPLLGYLPHWTLLLLAHLILLSLLGYGLRLFVTDWLHSIFVEQRKIAYYAAGTLVYAAVVSFIHLTWGAGSTIALPGGYYGPFLMTLCSLLFYVDAQFKHWTRQYAFLSHFSFVLYGLSVLALVLVIDEPMARGITLVLAIALYAAVVWHYLTLPPLYLLLACLSWLYGLMILQHVPANLHLLSSLPGLIGLHAMSQWAISRSESISLIGYRLLALLLFGLTAWSLWHGQPSLISFCTALTATVLAYSILKFVPVSRFAQVLGAPQLYQPGDLREGAWLYSVMLMTAVTLAYAPLWFGLDWGTQCAFGLTILALSWIRLGLTLLKKHPKSGAEKIEVLLNSAFLSLILALLIALQGWAQHTNPTWALPLFLAVSGGALLWLSLGLFVRWLFYGVLGLWGTAGMLTKLTYFPEPSTGEIEMVLALAVWSLLWWLEHRPEPIAALWQDHQHLYAARRPPVTLLWYLPVVSHHGDEDHV